MHYRWYAIAYDIPSDTRRNRLATWLEGWGERVQESLFECELTPNQYQRMLTGVRRIIEPATDRVRVYLLGERGYRQIDAITGEPPRPGPPFRIV